MNCEQATELLSAQLDREISSADRELLDRHLADCPACQATRDALRLQDQELRQAFEPRRQAAVAVAGQVNARLGAAPPTRAGQGGGFPPPSVVRVALAVGAIAAVILVVLLVQRWTRPLPTPERDDVSNLDPRHRTAPEQLTPRPRPEAPAPVKVAVGDSIETKPGERLRRVLPDQSVLYVDQDTALRVESASDVKVTRGRIYVEVAPREAKSDAERFVVRTSDRTVTATGTRFAVSAGRDGTGVVVTQGKVMLSGLGEALTTGQWLAPGSDKPAPAPRASHLLDWARDLMAAAESPLVPASKYDGGALIAYDANGQEAKLSLRKYHIDVHVEDGFARTTIDQTYFNHHPWRLEGTFFFPLPPDASLSRLAMYVDGKLMEGGMAERDYARQVYEQIVRSQRDPALLEWVDGSTFKMRVFPLEGRQEKRIILSYTQRLPVLYGQAQYRFPAGHSLQLVDKWSFHAHVKNGAGLSAASPTHPDMKIKPDGKDLLLDASAKDVKADRDVVIDLVERAADVPAGAVARFSRAEQDGARYLMLRYRPDLPRHGERQRRDWVILFESSADRDPLVARTQVEVVRNLLANVEHDDRFTVVTAGTSVRRFSDELLPATPENAAKAIDFLERTHLIGTLDLGAAFTAVGPLLKNADNAHLVHLGSGLTGMGREQDALGKLLPANARYVGIGVGKRWGRSSMKAQAERSGGFFTQINPDESIAWRTFDLLATLNTPRLLDVKVTANPGDGAAPVLVENPSVAHGEEVCAVTRLYSAAEMPRSLTIRGKVDGKPFEKTVPLLPEVPGGADYLPRTWAKLQIDRLLASGPDAHRKEIVELSKAMYVMTPFTSLLVLENEAMYRQFKVDRGRKDHWAMYPCPEKIDVVYEPDPTQPVDVRNAPKGTKPAANQVLQTILVRVRPRFLGGSGRYVMTAVEVYSGAYALAEPTPDEAGEWREGNKKLGDERFRELAGRLRRSILDSERVRAQTELGRLDPQLDDLRRVMTDGEFRYSGLRKQTKALGGLEEREGLISQRVLDGKVGLPALPAARAPFFDEPPAEFPAIATPAAWPLSGKAEPYGFYRLTGGDKGKAGPWGYLSSLRRGSPPGVNYYVLNPNGRYNLNSIADGASLTLGVVALDDAASMAPHFKQRLLEDTRAPSLVYTPARFSEDGRLFHDLLAYAPGLNTTWADIQAVLEEEAAPDLRNAPGHIDPDARRLIERSRSGGWQTLLLDGDKDEPALAFHFDGTGRYVYERTLPIGLRERVVCDGTTLLHLYPDLGLAARRTVSRFHRAELASLLPWALPPAEDLARGLDVKAIDAHTVALVPHPLKKDDDESGKAAKTYRVELVFADEGRLAERRLVEMPGHKVQLREVYDGKGGVRVLDAKDKEVWKHTSKLQAAEAPALTADLSKLVVLPMPMRSWDWACAATGLNPSMPLGQGENVAYQYLNTEQAMLLLASSLAHHGADGARMIYRRSFADHGDERPGFFPLLAACGVDVTGEPAFRRVLASDPKQPLLRYLALTGNGWYQWLQSRFPIQAGTVVAAPDTFFGRLATLHDLYLRWRGTGRTLVRAPLTEADERRTWDFIRANRRLSLAPALLTYVQGRGGDDRRHWLALADVWQSLAGDELRSAAAYERARCLYHGGKREEARKLFSDIYAAALKDGGLPRIDSTFAEALLGRGKEEDLWGPLMLETAARFVKAKQRPLAVALAWQCREVESGALADNLLRVALADLGNGEERLPTTLAAIEYLRHAGQLAQAESMASDLLKVEEYAKDADLWRLGAKLAEQRGKTAESIARLERALDLEYAHLPEVIDLQLWRNDYRKLLQHYQSLAQNAVMLKATPPADLASKTVRAADRWRAHDPEAREACQLAAATLKLLDVRPLAWEYLTTALADVRPGSASSLVSLAGELGREGDFDLADGAYAVAAEAEPKNATILWDRARLLRQAGKADDADRLLRRIADGDWPEWQRGIRDRARWQLQK